MRVVIFCIMCHLSFGLEEKALLKANKSAFDTILRRILFLKIETSGNAILMTGCDRAVIL